MPAGNVNRARKIECSHEARVLLAKGPACGRRSAGRLNLARPRRARATRMEREVMSKRTKFVFVTGGVVSSIGKGLGAASIGALMEARGLKVTHIKLDPYINVDPG